MSRLLLVGTGPLLEDGARIMSGQCLRTWHFTAPLLKHGHDVDVYTVPIPGATVDGEAVSESARYQGVDYTKFLSNDPSRLLPVLQAALDEKQYDAMIGVNAFPAFLLSQLEASLPMWADLNGWTMVEGQTRAAVVGHDNDFHHFWKTEASVVLRADQFSTVTERQQWALYGELAMLGRLTRQTFAGNLVHFVPNAVYPVYTDLKRHHGSLNIDGKRIEPMDLICFWSGGFNTWTDVDLLIEGLRIAFSKEPALKFVATGGPVVGHDEKTWEKFLKLVERHLDQSRVYLFGWTDLANVVALHERADVGINIDGQNTETLFGARNRLTNMMAVGMPVVTTRGTEIAEWIAKHGCGIVVEPGDAQALSDAILEGVSSREMFSSAAREKAATHFAAEKTVARLLSWCESPARLDQGHREDPPGFLQQAISREARQPMPFAPLPPEAPRPVLSRLKNQLKTIVKGNSP